MTSVLQEDFANLAQDGDLPWDELCNATIVVTGATGLIGMSIVGALLARQALTGSRLRVIALVRKPSRMIELFGSNPALSVSLWDASSPDEGLESIRDLDYIFHCANMTDSAAFIEKPVEVIETTIGGAQAMLRLAQRTNARLCMLSTMETYGEVATEVPLLETQGGFLDAMVVRNCYPEAKRLDEVLCASFAAEYGVDVCVARLAQTFGPGVREDDGRVFAYFARCARAGQDIVLLTPGAKRNAYLYTADAVRGLLFVAARGKAGCAYNMANDDTFCSVREMAELVMRLYGAEDGQVRIELDEQAAGKFRKGSTLRLDTSRLEALGWRPQYGLEAMYERLMKDWDEQCQ